MRKDMSAINFLCHKKKEFEHIKCLMWINMGPSCFQRHKVSNQQSALQNDSNIIN